MQQHLPAVTGCPYPRGTVDVQANVTLLHQQRRTGIETHTNRQPQLVLRLARRLERTRRGRKGDEEGVALRIDLHAAMALERLMQNAPVLR
jgi:hypothetical protein